MPKPVRLGDVSEVEAEITDKDRELGKLAEQFAEQGENPPAWVADEATWEAAKEAVEPHWGNYGEPWAVVTHVYFTMGGTQM